MKHALTALSLSAVLAACGGGGSSVVRTDGLEPATPATNSTAATPASTTTPTPTPSPSPSMSMACPAGVASCSGADDLIQSKTFNMAGLSVSDVDKPVIGVTSASVQTYAKSTSDLNTSAPGYDPTRATGMALASGGRSEMRLTRDGNGAITGITLILSDIGISWDGRNQRPTIIETFRTAQGRVQLDAGGNVVVSTLPAPGTASFYNYNFNTETGTQANYANNAYFPRAEPSRCPLGMAPCPTTETAGVQYQQGDWRSGGGTPDHAWVTRSHEDGDIHAGYTAANPAEGATGVGVPYPGSKGYRSVDVWSYHYASLGAWTTQDTVDISEWAAPGARERNQVRRGLLAFGDTTDPTTIPTSGTATYANGYAYGWYAANRTVEPSAFTGTASGTANFANRTMDVTVANTAVTGSGAAVPAGFSGTLAIGTGNNANYFTGDIAGANGMKGGASGRFFGPVQAGGSGSGPAEMGGVYSMTNGTASTLGGFIARKQ